VGIAGFDAVLGEHLTAIAWAEGEGRILTGNLDGNVRAWHWPTGQYLTFDAATDNPIALLARAADTNRVAAADITGAIHVWDSHERKVVRVNGNPAVGLGVVKQSTANTLEVARAVKREIERLRESLPEGMSLRVAFDSGRLHSMILWGPPGVGKTTLARLMAGAVTADFHVLSAVLAGVKDIRDAVERARVLRQKSSRQSFRWCGFRRATKPQRDQSQEQAENDTGERGKPALPQPTLRRIARLR